MFRITHISDTHGMFPNVPESSLIMVHSGDMFPNKTRGIRTEEEKFQREYVLNHMNQFKRVIGNKEFVFIPGNHDYFDPEEEFRKAGIRAHNIANKSKKVCGVKFYGFPYIPYIAGEWNYEIRESEMRDRVREISQCDILVAHCPPFGICADVEEGKGGGNSVLLNWLIYEAEEKPRYLMCGHFHQSRGIGNFEGMLVSNSALVQHTFEI